MTLYEYKARVLRVVDGDTVELEVDLGMDIRVTMMTRLAGINAPELHDATGAGVVARTFLMSLLPTSWMTPEWVLVATTKDRKEKFGRYLATLWTVTDATVDRGVSLNQQMIDTGHAVFYDGGKR